MKMPRDIGGEELGKLLAKYGYRVTRQTGSHIRLSTDIGGEHHITIPRNKSLKLGTLNSILNDIARHLGKDKQTLMGELFGR